MVPKEQSAQTFALRSRLSSAAAAFVILLMIGAVMSMAMVNAWSSALERRRSSRVALIEVNALEIGYSDQDSGALGYLLATDQRSLDSFDDASRRVAQAYGALAGVTAPYERFGSAVIAIHDAADAWLSLAIRPLIASADRGAVPDSQVLAFGRERYETLHDQIAMVRDTLDDVVQRAEVRSHRLERLAVTALLCAFGSGLVFAVIILVLIRRWMLDPLRELTHAAIAVAHGEPTAIARPQARELAIVADAVDFLQRSLSHERDNALRALQALEQSAVLALRVRAELANEIGTPPRGWDAHSSLLGAEGIVAGDCIDTGLLDASTMFVVVLDVTGHGATSALHALRAKYLVRMALRSGLEPGAAIEQVLHHQRTDERSEYLTAFVAIIDLSNGDCRYANAGHPPALLFSAALRADDAQRTDIGHIQALDATGPLIGPFDASWQTGRVHIDIGDTLVVHSDGLTDVRGADGVWLGEDRVRALITVLLEPDTGDGAHTTPTHERPPRVDAATVVSALEALAHSHRVGPQSDDMTLVVLQRLPENAVLSTSPTDHGHDGRIEPIGAATEQATTGRVERHDTDA